MYSKSLGERKFLSLFFVSSFKQALTIIALLSDTIIAGHFADEQGITAMNVMTPLIAITAFIGSVITMGVSFIHSEAMGETDKKKADKIFGMGIIISIVSGLFMFMLAEFFYDDYFDTMTLAPDVANHAWKYYSFYKFVMLIDPLVIFLSTMVYNDGDELISNISNVTNIFGNIIFSLIFAFVFNMGLAGIALGTFLKDIMSIVVLSSHFFRKSNSLNPKIYFSFRDLWKIIKLGFVDSGTYFMWGLLLFVMNGFIGSIFGTEFLPVLSMTMSILELSVIFDGIALAVIPLVSMYFYEENFPAVRKVMNLASKISMIEGLAFSVLLIIFADYVPLIFGINETNIIKECIFAVRVVSSTLVISSIVYLFETYYVIQNKTFIAVISSFARNLIFIILLSVPLGLTGNINNMWFGFAAAQILTLIFCSFILVFKYGRELFPLYLENKNNIADFNIVLTPENVMNLRTEAEKFMTSLKLSSDVINRTMLLIEETGMMIIERNKSHKILAEYTIKILDDNQARLIIRDNGEIFDITSDDEQVTSLRSYFLSGLMSIEKHKKNITTMSLNRNVFNISAKI